MGRVGGNQTAEWRLKLWSCMEWGRLTIAHRSCSCPFTISLANPCSKSIQDKATVANVSGNRAYKATPTKCQTTIGRSREVPAHDSWMTKMRWFLPSCKHTGNYVINLLLQVGAVPDHWPLAWQRRVVSPTSSKAALQVYVATENKVVEVNVTLPLSGESSLPQSTAAVISEVIFIDSYHGDGHNSRTQLGALPDQDPVSWQVLLDSPTRLYPVRQLYVAVSQNLVPVVTTIPFVGALRGPQSDTKEGKPGIHWWCTLVEWSNAHVHRWGLRQTNYHWAGKFLC